MIWCIESSQPTLNSVQSELPKLVRIGTDNNSTGNVRGIQAGRIGLVSCLDVVSDFYWTYSKKSSREEVPTIYLKEKRLKTNALVSQLKYSLGYAAAEAGTAAGKIHSLIDSIDGKENFFSDIFSAISNTTISAATSLTNAISKLLPEDENPTLKNSPALRPYQGLYITEPTNWEFLFPYFEDKFDTQGNQFTSEGTTNAFSSIFQGASNILNEISEIAGSIANPTNITYIERAKFFNFPTDGEEISFSFPLINTGTVSYDDVINNWQLIFLLLYNNKPGRLSPTQIEQPVIYEVEIPGVKYLPFCYISSIDIKFQGSRRELPIKILHNEQKTEVAAGSSDIHNIQNTTNIKSINTIVPDAYTVTITLKSMLGDTKNFMYHMINNGDVTVVGIK